MTIVAEPLSGTEPMSELMIGVMRLVGVLDADGDEVAGAS